MAYWLRDKNSFFYALPLKWYRNYYNLADQRIRSSSAAKDTKRWVGCVTTNPLLYFIVEDIKEGVLHVLSSLKPDDKWLLNDSIFL
jgi:hypothetical protein